MATAFSINEPGLCREESRLSGDWTTPTLVELCIGLEINGYLPAEL
jgi:coenzyme PQQ precursor peptide PqqA